MRHGCIVSTFGKKKTLNEKRIPKIKVDIKNEWYENFEICKEERGKLEKGSYPSLTWYFYI